MRRIFAQARKELIQITRDWRTLALALLLPLMLLFLLSTAISLTVNDLPMVVQDLDDSPASRDFIAAFRNSLTFSMVSWPTNKQPDQALVSNKARAVLIIPERFGRNIARGVATPVQLLVDASDANTAKLTSAYAAQVTQAYNSSLGTSAGAPLIQTAIRLWFNPGLSSTKFYGPGMFVLGLSMFPPLLAALAMAKEGEQKTILQVYVSSISAFEFMLGKVLAFMAVALAECVLMLIMLFTYFGLHFVADPSPFVVATILYAFCVASFGVMVGSRIPSQAGALQAVAFGGFLLVFLLSGLIFPIDNIPVGLRWLSNFVWGRYYIEIVRDALLQGGGWTSLWFNVVVIGIIGSIFFIVGWRGMRRMQLKV